MKSLDIGQCQQVCAAGMDLSLSDDGDLVLTISDDCRLELVNMRCMGYLFPDKFLFNRAGLWCGDDFLDVAHLESKNVEIAGLYISAHAGSLEGCDAIEYHISRAI